MTVKANWVGISLGLQDDLELVWRAERLGHDSVWTGEGQGKTAFWKLERWATVTDEVSLGAFIVTVFSRSPATVAQSVVTLDAHSDGRAVLGLGVGCRPRRTDSPAADDGGRRRNRKDDGSPRPRRDD